MSTVPKVNEQVTVACKVCREEEGKLRFLRRGKGMTIGQYNYAHLYCPRCQHEAKAALCFLGRLADATLMENGNPTCYTVQ